MSPDKGRSKSGGTSGARRTRKPAASADPAPRTGSAEWTIKPATAQALKEWEHACSQAPDLMAAERERPRTRPLDRSENPRRTAQLKYKLATRRVGDKVLPQWQREISAAGRVWYCPDKDERIVWITKAELSHPVHSSQCWASRSRPRRSLFTSNGSPTVGCPAATSTSGPGAGILCRCSTNEGRSACPCTGNATY